VIDEKGVVTHVIEMSTDILHSTSFNSEYNILFENVPTYVTIIDKNFNLIKANKKFRDTFGDARGRPCYEIYKKRGSACKHCPAALTFADGYEHSSTQAGLSFTGEDTYYVVSSTPLAHDENGVSLVIEMATDITEITKLQNQLIESHEFFSEIIKHSCEGIIAINNNNKVQVFNRAAKKILDWQSRKKPGFTQIKEVLPEDFFLTEDPMDSPGKIEEKTLKNYHGKNIVVDYNTTDIVKNKENIGRIAFFRDIRKNKALEKENLNLFRFASIGKTLEQLRITGSSLSESIRNDIAYLSEKKDDAHKDCSDVIDSLSDKFRRLSAYMKGMMGLPKLNPEKVRIINLYDYLEAFNKRHKTIFDNKKISLKIIHNEKVRAIPIETEQFDELLSEFILSLYDIACENSLPDLEIMIGLSESEGDLEISFITNYTIDETFRNLVSTHISYINLFVMVAGYGGELEIFSKKDLLSLSIKLNNERILNLLKEAQEIK
jgi:PAS domain S-box-containing protein